MGKLIQQYDKPVSDVPGNTYLCNDIASMDAISDKTVGDIAIILSPNTSIGEKRIYIVNESGEWTPLISRAE